MVLYLKEQCSKTTNFNKLVLKYLKALVYYIGAFLLFNLFKKRVTINSPRAEKFTYGENLENIDADELRNYTGDGVKIDRPLFAQTVEKHIKQTGVELDEEMLDMLTDYYEVVVRSNANINLTAITDPVEFATKHIIDSLMLPPFGG